MLQDDRNKNKQGLRPYMSPAAVLALSLGTSVGWGSLVVTSSTYLAQAGPMGSVLGTLAGGLIMLVISRNFYYMMNCVPEAGGAYAYARETFGFDHGFLAAWFLTLTYLAVFWANVTSLPLFARFFIGKQFQFGYLYSIFDYDVYLGEILLSLIAILLTGLICASFRKGISFLMTGMALVFCIGIFLVFAVSMLKLDVSLSPAYIPDKNALSQILQIASISSWAFIGFENISHATEEFSFNRERSFRILLIAVVITTLLYIFVTVLSVTAYPPRYSSWLEYINDRGNLSGIEGLPVFYAAHHYMGNGGVILLMGVLLCLVFTSLIGNTLALSRLFYALGRDKVLPARFADLNNKGIPSRAISLVVGVSLFIPLVGRTAIGWIVDVTTIGAVIVYGFVSVCAWKTADFRGDKVEKMTGLWGFIIMAAIGMYTLIPNLFSHGSIEPESYFLFVIWAILGFLFFRLVLSRDSSGRFGYSIIVWVGLLSLVLFVSLVWMSQNSMNATTEAMNRIIQHYHGLGGNAGDQLILRELAMIRYTNTRSIIVVIILMLLSLAVLLNNYALMSRRAREKEKELGTVREMANKDPLTGVKSKHAYAEMEISMNRSIKDGLQAAFGVLVCDVNGLKYINDTLGHKAGDDYIRSASDLICEIYLHSPVYRIGGDEFVVVLSGRDYDHRDGLLQDLNQRVEDNISLGKVVISGGMSDFEPGKDEDFHDVFERADTLMYQRKKELKAMGARTR